MDPFCAALLQEAPAPALWLDAVPAGFCTENDLVSIFRGLHQEVLADAIDSPLRVYSDGMLSLRDADLLARTPPAHGTTIRQWLESTLAAPHFGLVLNHTERWSADLSRRVKLLIAPLIEQWGAAQTAVDVVLFAGNYGYTPFGIHVDDPYTHTLHFQLSGAGKSMTLYDHATYERFAHNAARYFPDAGLPAGGQTWDMPAGSVFLLPAGPYHVGTNTDFSIGLAVAISRYPAEQTTLRAAREALQTNDPPLWLQAEAASITCVDWTRSAVEEMTASQAGNGCFLCALRRRSFALTLDDEIAVDLDFPPQALVRDDRLLLFSRGHRLETGMHPAKLRIVQQLLSTQSTTPRMLLQQEPEASANGILALLQELGACSGLHLTHPQNGEQHEAD